MIRRLFFDSAFDGGGWPGPPSGKASAGELWVGVAGLAGFLEGHLGLAPGGGSLAERSVALVPDLVRCDGFWSQSAQADPFEVARDLLRRRDDLLMAGWDGMSGSGRVTELAKITTDARPGLADRLRAAAVELEKPGSRLPAGELLLVEERGTLPTLVRRVLAAMDARGFTAREEVISPANATGDLASARKASWTPKMDGTLQLLRAQGPIAAAEETAAWLAAQDWRGRALVVGGTWLLDQALIRFGLPATGCAAPARENVLLQMLPLVLAAGEVPPDPARVLELLSLPGGPVPRSLGRHLLRALDEWPAVGSPAWEKAMADGLASHDDVEVRGRLKERMDNLFSPIPVNAAGQYAVKALRERLQLLAQWTLGRLRTDQETNANKEPDPPPTYLALAAQIGTLQNLLALRRADWLPATQLRRLLDLATEEAPAALRCEHQAGLAAVASPEAVAGSADIIVWFPFSHESAPTPARTFWGPKERAELAALRVELPDPGAKAVAAARRWRRPLEQATKALLLVCPETNERGEELFPHPLWDEIASATKCDLRALTPKSPMGITGPRATVPHGEIPRARRTWLLPKGHPIGARGEESASGLEQLLGCPLAWLLNYHAKLRPGSLPAVGSEADTRVLGSLAHYLIEKALAGTLPTQQEAADRAGRLFDLEAPQLVAGLFRPGRDRVRTRFRHAVAQAAGELARVIAAAGLRIEGFEQTREATLGSAKIKGRIDLLLGPDPVVLDMKYRGGTYYSSKLGKGTAVQLAVYAHLAAKGSTTPPVGYFIIEGQRLLTTPEAPFCGAEKIPGETMRDVWRAAEAGFNARLAELSKGTVLATAIDDGTAGGAPIEKEVLENGEIRIPAPCKFCDYGALCGTAYGTTTGEESGDD